MFYSSKLDFRTNATQDQLIFQIDPVPKSHLVVEMVKWRQLVYWSRFMKLIIAIIRDKDRDQVSQSLIQEEFRVTRIASTGGFLRRGMTTLMIGVEDEKVDQAIHLVGDNCTSAGNQNERCATIFVLKVDQFIQI
jgi:uncharacterized protein YaaQ